MTQTIGFIGLGAMGGPMAERLVDRGFAVVSCAHRRRETIERLARKGLEELADTSAVGARSDLLLSIVFDEPQSDRVLRGPEGALAAMKPGGVVLVMSTVSPGYCRELAEEASARGLALLDCPVSGLVKGAKEGTLTLMLGGDPAAIEPHRGALEVLGAVCSCGEVGMGQVMKVANNAMAIGTWVLLTEVRDMVRARGMEIDHFMSILNQSSGRSFVSENFRFPPTRIALPAMPKKDLSICLDVAAEEGVSMPVLREIVDGGSADRRRDGTPT